MSLTHDIIKEKLTAQFGDKLIAWEESYGMLAVTVQNDFNLKVLTFLNDDAQLGFKFMTDLTGVHYPDRKGEEIAVVYHLHNLVENVRMRVKVYAPIEKPDVYTATGLFSGANWMERETYDFYGVNFIGHPDLRRVLNVDEMDYFPLRKEFPLEDQTRIDKDDEMFGR
jgi:NADH-quinone oxidoreductase subunit C